MKAPSLLLKRKHQKINPGMSSNRKKWHLEGRMQKFGNGDR